MSLGLEKSHRLFQGIIPSLLSTCAKDGTPNITYISQVTYVDATHVAVSCQFFNKTKRNLLENPQAMVELWDPVTFEGYRMELRYVRSETAGPLFDSMAHRIDVIASHTGMAGVFKLKSADVCEVLGFEKIEGFLYEGAAGAGAEAPAPESGPLNELRALSLVSSRLNRACDLDGLLKDALAALDEVFRFRHSMVLLLEEARGTLVAIASHGYGESGVGAEVPMGAGLIGTVAERRVLLRLSGIDLSLRYGRAIREGVEREAGHPALRPEVPLPGLPDAEAQLALPLLVEDRLLGVLALESRNPLAFADWHEDFLQVLANQIAVGIDRLTEPEDEEPAASGAAPAEAPVPVRRHSFVFYKGDDCVFVDGEYLVRYVPGKILWKLLTQYRNAGRREFTNRELRLDPSLGLPSVKDNLESRLILLKKRLEQKCPDVRIVPVRRGRFALEVAGAVELSERETA